MILSDILYATFELDMFLGTFDRERQNQYFVSSYNDDIGIDWSNGHKGILHSGYSGK